MKKVRSNFSLTLSTGAFSGMSRPPEVWEVRGRPPEVWEGDLEGWMGTMWRRAAGDRQLWRNHAEAFAQQWADNGCHDHDHNHLRLAFDTISVKT